MTLFRGLVAAVVSAAITLVVADALGVAPIVVNGQIDLSAAALRFLLFMPIAFCIYYAAEVLP